MPDEQAKKLSRTRDCGVIEIGPAESWSAIAVAALMFGMIFALIGFYMLRKSDRSWNQVGSENSDRGEVVDENMYPFVVKGIAFVPVECTIRVNAQNKHHAMKLAEREFESSGSKSQFIDCNSADEGAVFDFKAGEAYRDE